MLQALLATLLLAVLQGWFTTLDVFTPRGL